MSRTHSPVRAVCSIESRSRQSRAIKAELGIRLAVFVHPGCTSVGLSILLRSRTNAGDRGCIGCSQARAKAGYKSSMAGVCARTHTSEHTASINSRRATYCNRGHRPKRERVAGNALPTRESLLRIKIRSARFDGSIETKQHREERLVSAAAVLISGRQ